MEKNQNPARVGEILLGAGVIDEMQLESALAEQRQWGRRLGVTLVKLGMVSENDLIRALAKQLGLPVASVAGKRIPEEVIALVPARVAFERGVLPLFLKPSERGSVLFLGMDDPSDLAVLDDLSFRTGLEIQPVMVGPTELLAAIDRFYSRSGKHKAAGKYTGAETLGELNLRRMDDPALGELEAPEESEEPTASPRATPIAIKPVDPAVGPETSEAGSENEAFTTGTTTLPPLMPVAAEPVNPPLGSGLGKPTRMLVEELEERLREAVLETDRTRVVLKAMTQILVERGLLPFTELQKRTAKLKQEETSR